MVRLLFSTRKSLGSAAIRVLTWSSWSHVALVDGDTVIEASTHGVRRIPIQEARGSAARHELVELACRDPRAVIAAAAGELGKPYDWTAIVGFALRRDWQENDSWFCSELVAWAFQQAGEPLFRPERMRRVTPEHLWMLAPMLHVSADTAEIS